MQTEEAAPRHPGSVQSVHKAIEVLHAMARHGREAGSTEIGALIGEHKAKVQRYLTTLEEVGLVNKNPITGKYHLGWTLLFLGQAAARQCDIATITRPFMQDLMELLNESVILHVWDGEHPVVAAMVRSMQPVNVGVQLGSQLDLHASACGKVMLAYLPAAQAAVQGQPLKSHTPATQVEWSQIEPELAAIRLKGFSLVRDELLEGITAVSAPIFSFGDRLQAALTIVGMTRSFQEPPRLTTVIEALLNTSSAISRSLGHTGRNPNDHTISSF